jgi:hypothetical protein
VYRLLLTNVSGRHTPTIFARISIRHVPATVYDSIDMVRTGSLRQYRLWHAPATVNNSRYYTYVLLFTVTSIRYGQTASTGYCLSLAMSLGLAVCTHQPQWCHLTQQFSLLDDVSERHWVDCWGNKKGDSLSSYAQFITQNGSKRSHHFQYSKNSTLASDPILYVPVVR